MINVGNNQLGKNEQRISNDEFVLHLKYGNFSIIYKMTRQDKLTKKAAVNTIIDSGLCFLHLMI